jgi:hypothetical protein
MRKIYSLAKFANFVYTFVLRAEIPTYGYSNFRTPYRSIQNFQTLQGYIFRILQHFTTKLCNFTHFSMALISMQMVDFLRKNVSA